MLNVIILDDKVINGLSVTRGLSEELPERDLLVIRDSKKKTLEDSILVALFFETIVVTIV